MAVAISRIPNSFTAPIVSETEAVSGAEARSAMYMNVSHDVPKEDQ